jgi:protocatechuate 3,4-dioxygenase beta subunit
MGGSIATEGKGEYMYVEGRVLNTDGKPIPDAVIETWEADSNGMLPNSLPILYLQVLRQNSGFYDTQYERRDQADCRGRVRSDKDGKYGYRAVVPVAYPIPGDVRVFFL